MKLLEIPEQAPIDDVDEEILEIFVEEVGEVLEEITSAFNAWQENPADEESLKNLRRAFHTLKGSGRLVGATVIGELGWRFENMLNRIIDGTMSRSDTMMKLIAQVERVLPTLIKQFQNAQPAQHDVIVLISQVHHFTETKGQSLGDFAEAEKPQEPPVLANSNVVNATAEVSSDTEHLDSITDENELSEFDVDMANSVVDGDELSEFDVDMANSVVDGDELSEFDVDADETFEFDDNLELTEDELAKIDENQEFQDTLFPEEKITTLVNLEEEEVEAEAVDPVLINIFRKEASQHLEELKRLIEMCEQDLPLPMAEGIIRNFHTLNGSSRSVNFLPVSTIAKPMEQLAREMQERHTDLTADTLALFQQATSLIEQLLAGKTLDEAQSQALLVNTRTVLDSLPPLPPSRNTVQPPETNSAETPVPDATDEFMAIFLDEAEEILQNTQSLLERWQSAPHNMQLMRELQRELHTLKGGARMVGITPMGDLSHHLESVLTQIVEGPAKSNPKLQEVTQNSVDELAAMLEAVRSGVPLEPPNDLIAQINATLKQREGEFEEPPPKLEKESKPKPVPLPIEEEESDHKEVDERRIQIKATLIDRLTNLAGELSISRAHMEQQQGVTKNNLAEMEQTVARLRDQLRRLEIETEAQILSRYSSLSVSVDEEFDPLELDRFSLLQQLSRSLMETISDLLNIQDALKIVTRQSDTLLVQQARIGAELQENIMRTRMMPFARISPKLQRIARLTARELRKNVEFTINGENIEFERTVLDRIVAPLEHMLRNAIGHGVEDTETRQQAGKPTTAQVTIDLMREGSDLIIKMADDGRGLNLQAIRRKAEERGIIEPGRVVSDQELKQFILLPAFSTASSVNQIAGRGVGMDVVNTEIKQLSGSLQIFSKAGEGTAFEIRLPLSLTINQALLVHIGEETMAVPLSNVEAVLRVPRQEVLNQQPEDIRYYKYMGQDYRVSHLGNLLGFFKTVAVDSVLIPTLLIRSGNQRIALLVDGIEGSREIVVKSVGPQIGTIQWISGATILGDGRVVLILDMLNLARIDKVLYEPLSTSVTPIPSVATIMVVDDSITVRKVTARLLKRQGMEVLMAKDGVDAVAQLQEQVPDLMLLDVEMPRMDGYELATQVRNDPQLKHIPIIMITSRTGVKHRDRAEKIGINRYLGKPFNEAELLENINALLTERVTH